MKKIIPITDLQRQAAQIVGSLSESEEPFIITQRGRAAVVLMLASRYEQIERDLARLDELELREMLAAAEAQIAQKKTVSHRKVKERLAKRRKKTAPRRKRKTG